MSKQNLNDFFARLWKSVFEQKLIFVVSLISFITSCITIFYEGKSLVPDHLFQASLLALVLSLPLSRLTKNLPSLKKYLCQIIGVLIAGVIGYFAADGFGDVLYAQLFFYGLLAASMILFVISFIPAEVANAQSYFANFVKNALFCLLMTVALSGGLSVLFAAIQNLIYKFPKSSEIYICIWSFGFTVFFVNVFSYFLFFKSNEQGAGKAFKIIFLYILFPIYCVLLGVLYAYLLKALFTWKLPQGHINWFVSFACFFYFVFHFLLHEYENTSAVKLFYKYGALLFIPLICAQIIAYSIRVNAYGFTAARYASLLFIIFSTLMIAVSFIKKQNFERLALIVLFAFVIFATLSPWNLIDIPFKNQFARMEKILYKYNMYDGQQLLPYDAKELDKEITDKDRAQLFSSYYYLRYNSDKKKPAWFVQREASLTMKGKSRSDNSNLFFGISETAEDSDITYFVKTVRNKPIDISGFSTLEAFYSAESQYTSEDNPRKNKTAIIIQNNDISDYLLKLKDDDTEYYYDCPNGDRLHFTYIYYSYNTKTKEFIQYTVRGYFLRKKQ